MGENGEGYVSGVNTSPKDQSRRRSKRRRQKRLQSSKMRRRIRTRRWGSGDSRNGNRLQIKRKRDFVEKKQVFIENSQK